MHVDRRLVVWGSLLLCLLAVAELAGRASFGMTQPAFGAPAASPPQSFHIAGTDTSLNGQGAVAVLLLGAFATLPLAFLGPVAAAAAITAASTFSIGFYHVQTVAGLAAQLLAAYWLGRNGRARGSEMLALVLAVPYLVLAIAGSAAADTRVLVVLLVALGPAAALLGIAERRSALAAGAAEQAVAGTLLKHVARGERARIARELHDVVAHHVSMVAVQAETARLATPGMPELGAKRLLEIGDTARAGLTEMRRLLGVLREDAMTAGAADEPRAVARAADRQPQPGLPQLNELLDEAREASGAGVRLIVSGPVTRLDPGVELAAYRIVQEALTNSRRHAPGAAVDVELRYGHDALRLRIRDNGPGMPAELTGGAATGGAATGDAATGDFATGGRPGDNEPGSGGHGLIGMRERAQAVGGELHAGPAEGGGFLVEGTLPMTSQPAGAAA
jgi:signal transduction histidine kinase